MSVTPNTAEQHGSPQLYTLHASEAPSEVYYSTMVFSFAFCSSVGLGSTTVGSVMIV